MISCRRSFRKNAVQRAASVLSVSSVKQRNQRNQRNIWYICAEGNRCVGDSRGTSKTSRTSKTSMEELWQTGSKSGANWGW